MSQAHDPSSLPADSVLKPGEEFEFQIRSAIFALSDTWGRGRIEQVLACENFSRGFAISPWELHVELRRVPRVEKFHFQPCSFAFPAATLRRGVFTRATLKGYHGPYPFIIQLSFIINVIRGRISLSLRAKNLYRLRNDYAVCIQNSGFCQLWPRLRHVFRLRMCARPPAPVLNTNLNLTVGGRRCFSYIKVAVSHGKLQLWGFKAETASILLQGFARLVNFCDNSLSSFSFPSSPISLVFCTNV